MRLYCSKPAESLHLAALPACSLEQRMCRWGAAVSCPAHVLGENACILELLLVQDLLRCMPMVLLRVNVLCSYYVVLPLSLLPEGLWRRMSHGAWPRRAPDALAVLMRMRSVFAALPLPALLVQSVLSMLSP